MEENRKLANNIIDKFEELLQKHNIKLPSDERTGEETEACIFGKEYYELEDIITEILDNRKFIAYQIEVGVLDRPKDIGQGYDVAWDKKHSYYSEEWGCYRTYEEAKDCIDYYMEIGVINTYGIISKLEVREEDYYNIYDGHSEDIEFDGDLGKVVYNSFKNEKNEIVENFIASNACIQEECEEETR